MNMKKEKDPGGRKEVEYKTKSGTAWSHSYLNQKPWHPLSYPNQRRKWIAEQTHSERQRKTDEVAREFAQEQDFLRTSALLSKKEREKSEAMQAVSFMYMRPPGYNAESARAAELADEKKSLDNNQEPNTHDVENKADPKMKPRVKDLYGRTIPTEEEFPILKNAPRLESGTSARVKPFAVEIRNVKCARCGAFGHQSGDRECPLKDSIMPNEEARQRRDDPLTIMNAVANEPLKWELKQRPGGLSPPRGGFKADDANQQIIPEDIYDEYGGFLAGGTEVEDLLASLSHLKKRKGDKKKRQKYKGESGSDSDRKTRRKEATGDDDDGRKRRKGKHVNSSDTHSDVYYKQKRNRERERRKHSKSRKEDKRLKKKRRHSSSSSDSNSSSSLD